MTKLIMCYVILSCLLLLFFFLNSPLLWTFSPFFLPVAGVKLHIFVGLSLFGRAERILDVASCYLKDSFLNASKIPVSVLCLGLNNSAVGSILGSLYYRLNQY